MIRVSVIVPAYNEEKFIARTLKSLKEQTYPHYELLVVDNNSTDQTNQIAQRFSERVVVETQKGYMNAVMRGVKESDGELITFCDADTVYPSNWLEKVVKVFDRHPDASAVYGGCRTHDSSFLSNYINQLFYMLFLYVSRFLGLDNTSGFNFVIRRSAFEQVGGYDVNYQKMSPDIELGKRLKKVGPIIFRPSINVLASFRRYQDSGALKTQWMFFKSWWAMLRGHTPSVSYEDYNKEIR